MDDRDPKDSSLQDPPPPQPDQPLAYTHTDTDTSKIDSAEILLERNERKECIVESESNSDAVAADAATMTVTTTSDGAGGHVMMLLLLLMGGYHYERRLQRCLTRLPRVYGQCRRMGNGDDPQGSSFSPSTSPLVHIYEFMTTRSNSNNNRSSGILDRPLRPSLMVGTRGWLSSLVAYLKRPPPTSPQPPLLTPSPSSADRTKNSSSIRSRKRNGGSCYCCCCCFRELMTMTGDGATVALDWELPYGIGLEKEDIIPLRQPSSSQSKKMQHTANTKPYTIVLIVHGINNHAGFGYVKSLMRACTQSPRQWIAVGLNMRGCGYHRITTPRAYTGAYTGDLRCIVHRLSARFANDTHANLFLVGYSLGANLITKYLGEEGYSGTLPACVIGGIALGNPLVIGGGEGAKDGKKGGTGTRLSPLLALGIKKTILEHWFRLQPMMMGSTAFRDAIFRALKAWTLADLDRALAPFMVRNTPTYPFVTRIGYLSDHDDYHEGDPSSQNKKNQRKKKKNHLSYWTDASSFRHVSHITVPTMQVVAANDTLAYPSFCAKLRYCLQNPFVMVVETHTGGHLGWFQEVEEGLESTTRNRLFYRKSLFGTSWADALTCEFIAAVLESHNSNIPCHNTTSIESPVATAAAAANDGSTVNHTTAPPPPLGAELLRVHSKL